MIIIQLNSRLKEIIKIVREYQPITAEAISSHLNLTRATLRPDLAILTMSHILSAKPHVGYFYIGMDDQLLVSLKLKETIVEDLMSLPIVVSADTTIYDTIVTLFLEDVGNVFVTLNGYLHGIVSRKDLLRSIIGGNDIYKLPVTMVMTRMPNVIFAKPSDSSALAAKKIIDHEIDSLPVVIGEDVEGTLFYKIIGRFTKTNIAKLFVELTNI